MSKKRVEPIRPRRTPTPAERAQVRATVCEALGTILFVASLLALPTEEISLWWSLWAAVLAVILVGAGQIMRRRAR